MKRVLTAADISCVVIPDGCVGLPKLAALEQGIAVIAVRENRNRMKNDLEELGFAAGKLFIVENYLEAIGIMTALKSGVAPLSVRRPLKETKVSTGFPPDKYFCPNITDVLHRPCVPRIVESR